MSSEPSNSGTMRFMCKRVMVEDTDQAIGSLEHAMKIMSVMASDGRLDEDFVLVVNSHCYYEMLKCNTLDTGTPIHVDNRPSSTTPKSSSNDQLITGLSLGILLG